MTITSFVDNINLSQPGRSKSVKHVERILIPRVYKSRGGYSVRIKGVSWSKKKLNKINVKAFKRTY